jgi:hypothetical protein
LAEKLLLGFSSAKSQGAGQDLATDWYKTVDSGLWRS